MERIEALLDKKDEQQSIPTSSSPARYEPAYQSSRVLSAEPTTPSFEDKINSLSIPNRKYGIQQG